MKYDKFSLRKKYLSKRKKYSLRVKKFNFDMIFKLIKKKFSNKKITIAGYYPSNYEVNILSFLKSAEKKNFKIVLPVIGVSNKMTYKSWAFMEPLYVSQFGTLEPKKTNKEIIPDLIIVPLVAYDHNLNRIGYGKGFYDRNLQKISKIKKNIVSVGMAYSFQECPTIPISKYDFKLNYIFTEQGIIKPN